MATSDLLIDTQGDEGNSDVTQLVKDLNTSITQPELPAEKQELNPENAPARPAYIEEKYWTGDMEASLAKQHEGLKALQKSHGTMANDLGAQRRLTDELIGLKRGSDLGQPAPTQESEPEPLPTLTASALLEKPDAALDDYLSAREKRLTSAYETRIAGLEAQLQGVSLASKHENYAELENDPAWLEFLNSTPLRQRQANYAANGDEVVASALIEEFRATSAGTTSAETKDLTPVGDDTDGAAAQALATAASSDGTSTGKVYSRTALMLLKQQQPEVYEDDRFQAEIIKAYKEGRVK
jgi:hypothetical protein